MKTEETKGPDTAIVIFTRYFYKKNKNGDLVNGCILNHLSELKETVFKLDQPNFLKIFFTSTIWKKLSPDNEIYRYKGKIKSTQAFWKNLKHLYKDHFFHKIQDPFSGKIYCYDESNVFLYHHWLDKQLTIEDPTVVVEYVESVIRQIWILRKKPNFKWYIFLHDGDFLRSTKGKELTKENFSPIELDDELNIHLNNDFFIERFSHDAGYPVWDYLLNNNELHAILTGYRSSKSDFRLEEYILSYILPNAIENRFIELINK